MYTITVTQNINEFCSSSFGTAIIRAQDTVYPIREPSTDFVVVHYSGKPLRLSEYPKATKMPYLNTRANTQTHTHTISRQARVHAHTRTRPHTQGHE